MPWARSFRKFRGDSGSGRLGLSQGSLPHSFLPIFFSHPFTFLVEAMCHSSYLHGLVDQVEVHLNLSSGGT